MVLGELASGGMGRVDLARVIADGDVKARGARRILAVKRLHPHLARDARFVEMFLDEVWMTAALRHPNVVELVGWGRDVAGCFLAMEFVHGAALSVIERAGRDADDPLPPELIAFIGARVAEGLGAAHSLVSPEGVHLEMIHRDVTPSNILIGFDGSVKITDFGVAKAAGRNTHTATGVLKGKVSYMSPEYARAQGFDHRSDIYSMGVALFELATGCRPFTADHDLELLRLIMEEPAPPIESLEPGFDRELAELIHELLLKEPSERPASGEAVRRSLDGWLDARGYDRAGLERSLAAYAERHAADRKAEVAALLGIPDPTLDSDDDLPADSAAGEASGAPAPKASLDGAEVSPAPRSGPVDSVAPAASQGMPSPRRNLPAIPRPPRPKPPPRPSPKHEESQLLTVLRSAPPPIELPPERPRAPGPLPPSHDDEDDADATTALPAIPPQDDDAATLFPPIRLVQDPPTEALPSEPTAMLPMGASPGGWRQEMATSQQFLPAVSISALPPRPSPPIQHLAPPAGSGLAAPTDIMDPDPRPFRQALSTRDLMGVGLVTFILVAIVVALLLPWTSRPASPAEIDRASTALVVPVTAPIVTAGAGTAAAPPESPTVAPAGVSATPTSSAPEPPRSSKPKAPAPKRTCLPMAPDYPRCLPKK
jgi:serine/threonine protein kinase